MIFILRGPNCVGKDRFADAHFQSNCVLSTDDFRLRLFDDTSKQNNASAMVYELIKNTLEMRLRFGCNYTVINSSNLKFHECGDYLALAKRFKRTVKFISFDPPSVDVLRARYAKRDIDEPVDFEKQCTRYYTLMPRFQEAAKYDTGVEFVRINQDWEIVE